MGRAYRQCGLFTRLNLIFTPFRISDAQRRPPFPFITAHEVGVLNEKRCKKKAEPKSGKKKAAIVTPVPTPEPVREEFLDCTSELSEEEYV